VSLLLLTVLATAVAMGGWIWLAEREHPGHLRALLDYQFGEGFTEHPKRIYLYFDQLLLRTAPWGIFAAGACWWTFRHWRRNGFTCVSVPAFAVAVCLVVMTIVPNKRAHYMLPALPMWVLFLAGFIDRGLTSREGRVIPEDAAISEVPTWAFDWPLRILLTVLAAASLAAPFMWWVFARGARPAGASLAGVIAVVSVAGAVYAWRNRMTRALGMLMIACGIGFASLYPLVLPNVYRVSPDRAAVTAIARAVSPGLPLADYMVRNEYLSFKLNRPIVYAGDREKLQAFLRAHEDCCVMLPKREVAALRNAAGRPMREVFSGILDETEISVLHCGPGGG